MSLWKFILINSSGSETEVDNPQGWDNAEVEISRDNNWHGIFFSYVYQELRFYGTGASLIKAEYDEKGVDGDMEMSVLFQCSDGETYDEFYRGRLAFDGYAETCGDECIVTISLQDSNDIMLMRNNYEQKVNLNSNIAFDETTELTEYNYLNFDLEIPSRGIPAKSYGSNNEAQSFDLLDFPQWSGIKAANITGDLQGYFMPIFANTTFSEIENTTINSTPSFSTANTDIPPFIDWVPGSLQCSPDSVRVRYRVKGRLQDITNAERSAAVILQLVVGSQLQGGTVITTHNIASYFESGDVTTEYDVSFDDFVPLSEGQNIYLAFTIQYQKFTGAVLQFLIPVFDIESFFETVIISHCAPTTAKTYLINEAISRTVEAITNDKIRFFSNTFGRTNSQPYSIPGETCAGAFAVSNGINVRRRLLTDGSQPGCFVSLQQLFEEMKSIWNIGLTIEPDLNRPGFNRLRFEDWRYFYQDDTGIRFNYPTSIRKSVDLSKVFNRIAAGYNKWTAGEFSGLDELMTKRRFRVNINATSNELDITSDIIVAPYTWEITRRLDTGTEDWQYDNDLFGVCLKGTGDPIEYSVETFADVAYSVENIKDPDTCYNGRISPIRNVMRWFNVIMQGLRHLQVDSKLIFTEGEANYIAKFGLNSCNIEGAAIQENESIELADFENPEDAKPPLFAETLVFEHPLNFNLFKKIKNEPALKYKSIEINCNGTMIPAWLKSISYKPEEGQATITAIPKNNSVLPEIPGPEPCQASIVEGSVTMEDFDFEAGTAIIDFTEGNPGATLWSYIITQGETPGAGTGFSGTTTEHPFTVGDLTPGTWSVFIVPYCSPDQVGINYGAGTFELEAPEFAIELTATLTNFGSNNHLVLTAQSVGDVPAPATFSFQWGQCVVNTSIPTEACRAYPGSPLPSPTNTLTFNAGETTVTQQSVTITAGSSYGYVTKVVLYNLSGITSADISKAAGQGWTLQFM